MTSSERWVVVGGLGLAAASLVPWYEPLGGRFVFDRPTRTNGWQEPDALLSQVAIVGGTLLAVVVLAVSRQPDRPRTGPLSWGTLLTAPSAGVFGLVALKFSLNLDGTTVGVYLALVASATQLYGSYVTRLDEPRAPPEAAPSSVAPGARPSPTGGPPRSPPTPPAPLPPASVAPGMLPVPPPPHPGWPETTYFLSTWLRGDIGLDTAVGAYRLAFAADPARLARLSGELRTLLDPSRGYAEASGLVAAYARHLAPAQAVDVLGQILQALSGPPGP